MKKRITIGSLIAFALFGIWWMNRDTYTENVYFGPINGHSLTIRPIVDLFGDNQGDTIRVFVMIHNAEPEDYYGVQYDHRLNRIEITRVDMEEVNE